MILSGLSAGLWWSINWFVAELRVEAEKERARKEQEGTGGAGDVKASEGSDTEGETASKVIEVGDSKGRTSGSHAVEVVDAQGEVKDRRGLDASSRSRDASRSEASTEDEWERVEESEKDK